MITTIDNVHNDEEYDKERFSLNVLKKSDVDM